MISDKQSTFIEGRSLTNNALIVFEIYHYIRQRTKRKIGVAWLKIDVFKEYDKLEWQFLKNMLYKFGFYYKGIDRVMLFVRSVTNSFLHNGLQFGKIKPQRGIRYDDPLTLYLYILCADGLSVILQKNEDAELIYGCTIGRGASNVLHLLFDDDYY